MAASVATPPGATTAATAAEAVATVPNGTSPAHLPSPPNLPKKVVLDGERRPLTLTDLAFAVHALAFLCYVRVWTWHFTPAAQGLPGAIGFGWFFRYLTFYSFTLQMVQLLLCCLADLSANTPDSKQKRALAAWADDVSCAIFGLANCVTLMYYIIDSASNKHAFVEGGDLVRPPWLGFSVHVFNSLVAWADLLLAGPRSFSRRSSHLSIAVVAVYMAWILLVSHVSGEFPYPFLNKLPFPAGFCGVAVGGILLFVLLFNTGKLITRPINAFKSQPLLVKPLKLD